MENKMPQLKVNLSHLRHNVKEIVAFCDNDGIVVTGVIKGFNGIPAIASAFVEGGCHSIGSSRINQLKGMKSIDKAITTMLVRIPMLSELDNVVEYADISLNSEWETMAKMNEICKEKDVKHEVILMFDLGDLREGFFDASELIEVAVNIENQLDHIVLKGIGTNVGCYGSIRPTIVNMKRLIEISESVEEKIGRRLEIISGGASTSLSLLKEDKMPERINHLRIGEAITLNKDLVDYWGYDFSHMYDDVFIMSAEIIEIKEKASHPIGEIFIDAFGNKPIYEDIGMRKRALLAVGRQDFANHHQLIPTDPDVKIVGSSSDHFIIDITNSKNDYRLGDTLSFQMYYEALLYLSGSREVNVKIVE
jgi:predicted amino acid racemase